MARKAIRTGITQSDLAGNMSLANLLGAISGKGSGAKKGGMKAGQTLLQLLAGDKKLTAREVNQAARQLFLPEVGTYGRAAGEAVITGTGGVGPSRTAAGAIPMGRTDIVLSKGNPLATTGSAVTAEAAAGSPKQGFFQKLFGSKLAETPEAKVMGGMVLADLLFRTFMGYRERSEEFGQQNAALDIQEQYAPELSAAQTKETISQAKRDQAMMMLMREMGMGTRQTAEGEVYG